MSHQFIGVSQVTDGLRDHGVIGYRDYGLSGLWVIGIMGYRGYRVIVPGVETPRYKQ